jgi:hypothetical protein
MPGGESPPGDDNVAHEVTIKAALYESHHYRNDHGGAWRQCRSPVNITSCLASFFVVGRMVVS